MLTTLFFKMTKTKIILYLPVPIYPKKLNDLTTKVHTNLSMLFLSVQITKSVDHVHKIRKEKTTLFSVTL